MQTFFDTETNNLKDFFESISEDDIMDCFDAAVFYRGRQYYDDNVVENATFNGDTTKMTFEVNGSQTYRVIVELKNGKVFGSCTCPFGGGCKHLAAALLYSINNITEINSTLEVLHPENKVEAHLQSLSKNQLINLLKKYAPDKFWLELSNKYAKTSVAQDVCVKVKKNIEKLFAGEDVYYPDDFEAILEKELFKLRGFQLKEIGDLILYIIEQTGVAMDHGYLYDSHNDIMYEPSDEFVGFIVDYVKSLSFQDKTEFISRLQEKLNDQSYDIFSPLGELTKFVFTGDDLPHLKGMLLKEYRNLTEDEVDRYYEKVKELLSDHERELLLSGSMVNIGGRVIELARLYKSQNEPAKALRILKAYLNNHKGYGQQEIHACYLELLSYSGLDLTEAANLALEESPTCEMLQKIASLNAPDLNKYEQKLEIKSSSQLLEYFEKENRLEEAVALIKRRSDIWSQNILSFYRKHKKTFPLDAQSYFVIEINKNLEFTGDFYYNAISDILRQLLQINKPLALQHVSNIRNTYKRRRNLMALLEDIV